MRKRFLAFVWCLILLTGASVIYAEDNTEAPQTEAAALERAKNYAQAINHEFKTPEKIYAFLRRDFREKMTAEEFCAAFGKERSYPYITPLYIFYPEVTAQTESGGYIVTFLQAARLEGMKYEIEMVYEDGNWFVDDWGQFLDGSYLEKFKDIPYSLDWYYDFGG